MKKFFDGYREYIIAFLSLTALVIILIIFDIPCPIKHLTGMSCAGCGMTRALISAMTFDFSAAFAYHPLWVILFPALLTLLILKARGKRIIFNIACCIIIVIFLSVWIYRIAVGSETVAFDFEGSAINRMIQKIYESAEKAGILFFIRKGTVVKISDLSDILLLI